MFKKSIEKEGCGAELKLLIGMCRVWNANDVILRQYFTIFPGARKEDQHKSQNISISLSHPFFNTKWLNRSKQSLIAVFHAFDLVIYGQVDKQNHYTM